MSYTFVFHKFHGKLSKTIDVACATNSLHYINQPINPLTFWSSLKLLLSREYQKSLQTLHNLKTEVLLNPQVVILLMKQMKGHCCALDWHTQYPVSDSNLFLLGCNLLAFLLLNLSVLCNATNFWQFSDKVIQEKGKCPCSQYCWPGGTKVRKAYGTSLWIPMTTKVHYVKVVAKAIKEGGRLFLLDCDKSS